MREKTEHPKRLWLVDEDVRAGFTVRAVDVTPVHPERAPARFSCYYIAGKPDWHTASLDCDAFRTKVEALAHAVSRADEETYEWEQKGDALREQLALAEEEAAAQEGDDDNQDA